MAPGPASQGSATKTVIDGAEQRRDT